MPLGVLFGVLMLVFAAGAVISATAGQWVIAVCALAIAGWFSTLSWSILRKRRA